MLMAIGAVACSTTSQIPLDDAYYWPSSTVQATQTTPVHTSPSTQSTPSIQRNPSTPSSSKIEYLNVQDTTVTVRIKR